MYTVKSPKNKLSLKMLQSHAGNKGHKVYSHYPRMGQYLLKFSPPKQNKQQELETIKSAICHIFFCLPAVTMLGFSRVPSR